MKCSRRHFLRAALAAAGLHKLRAAELGVDRLRDSAEWTGVRTRAYRADCVVTLLGVPIFSRQGVGSAAARLRESVHGERKTLSLCFAGGSDPKRTHGLNYAGWTEEIAVENASRLEEAASFGFVTASPSDESFEDARHRVMDGDGRAHSAFVAVDERHAASHVSIRKAFLGVPDAPGTSFALITDHVRSEFSSAKVTEREIPITNPAVPATFLYSVLSVFRSPERKSALDYIHDGKHYRLECEKSGAVDGLIRVNARIHNLENKSNANFRLWIEAGSDLPQRIEFSPRSYLRINLVFDRNLKEDV